MLPFRMNLVSIKIMSFSHTSTNWDPDFREPVSDKSFESVVEVKGQVNWGRKDDKVLRRTRVGDAEPSYCWLVFRKKDLEDQGVEIKKNDKVIEIAGKSVDLVVNEVRNESPLRGEFLLTYVDLREPKEAHVA